MKTEPIVAATVDFTSDAAPRAPAFDDLYHPREGALEQARGVFLAGNRLPERWRGRPRFTVLETGFGLGHNFLATWAAWRDDPVRCERLHFISLDKHPPAREDLARALATSPLTALAEALIECWPPPTPNLHSLDFDAGRVRLLLGLGDATVLARELVASVDAFFLDGFAPARNPEMWSERLFKALARLAAPGATAATWSAARAVRDGLAAVGFEVEVARGPLAKRDITRARFAPRFTPPPPPGRAPPQQPPSHAIVVGGGIAGAAVARALVHQGVACTVLDRADVPASQASGNPAGLFHGTVGVDDTPYTRLHRAASFHAARWVREAGAGRADGLLRLHDKLDLAGLNSIVAAQALPDAYVQALDARAASALAGVPLSQAAWLFGEGGWADPTALVRHAFAANGVTWRGGVEVRSIDADREGWILRDDQGCMLGQAPLVVLANAQDALRLADLPLCWTSLTRGQLSWLEARDVAPGAAPQRPLASGAYVLGLPDGRLLMGATQQANDPDPSVRASDHATNLASARRLLGCEVALPQSLMRGRVGWRVVTRDRLPLAGRVPDLAAPLPARRDAPRLVARRPGLYLLCALGSRGLTTAALCAELIAAQATGAPWPLEADLADAIDPARLALR